MEEVMADYNPPLYEHEIRLQNLAAVLECTSRKMVPRRFQDIPSTKLLAEIQQLKALLREQG